MQAIAFVLLGIPLAAPFLYLSVILFGLSAWSIPGIMGAAIGDYMGPRQAVRSLGIITGFVGIGQATGPVVAGVLAEWSGTFDSSYLLAAVFAVLGGIFSLTLRPRAAVTVRPEEGLRRLVGRSEPNSPAGNEYDDGAEVADGDGRDERVLVAGQPDRSSVHALALGLAGEDAGDVAVGNHAGCVGNLAVWSLLFQPDVGAEAEVGHHPGGGAVVSAASRASARSFGGMVMSRQP
jgi:MFS family permease